MKPINATKDFLTNCYTREAFIPFLKRMEEEYLNNKKPFSVLIMDVDHFKSFNDKYGHLYGDEVLKYFSSSLRLDLEDEENVPFRFGGDEFVMVFPNKTANDAHNLAARLKKNIRTRSCLIKGRQISITFSGGLANYPADASKIEELLEKADKALYYSKNHGRGRITKFSDLAQKELLQIAIVVVILSLVGGLFYFFRESLSTQVNRVIPSVSRWVVRPPEAPAVAPAPVPAPEAPATPPVAPTPTEAAGPEVSQVWLRSGRVIKGDIVHEDAEVVEVQPAFQEGRGLLQIKKSQIVRIERAREEL